MCDTKLKEIEQKIKKIQTTSSIGPFSYQIHIESQKLEKKIKNFKFHYAKFPENLKKHSNHVHH